MGFIDWLGDVASKVNPLDGPQGVLMDIAVTASGIDDQKEAQGFSNAAARTVPGARRGGGGQRNYTEATPQGSWITPELLTNALGIYQQLGGDENPALNTLSSVGGVAASGMEAVGEGFNTVIEPYVETAETMKRAGTTALLTPVELTMGRGIESAWDRAGETSFGQAIGGFYKAGLLPNGFGDKDYRIFSPEGTQEAIKEYQKDWMYNVATGTTDAIYSLAMDPLIVGGKALQVVRLRKLTRPIRPSEDVATQMADPASALQKRTSRLWAPETKKWGAYDFYLADEAVRNSTNPALFASALARANRITDDVLREKAMKLTTRVSMNDAKAIEELRVLDPITADAITYGSRAADDAIEAQKIDILTGGTVKFDDLAAVKAIDDMRTAAVESQASKEFEAWADFANVRAESLQGVAQKSAPGRITASGREAVRRAHPDVFVHQATPWSKVIAMVNWGKTPIEMSNRMKANGFVQYDDPQAHKEIGAFLNSVKAFSSDERASLMNGYMQAASVGEKMVSLQGIEKAAMTKAASERGLSPKTAQKIYDEYANAKGRMWGSKRESMYSAAEDPLNPGKTLDVFRHVEDGTEYRLPLSPSQLKSTEPMIDMQLFEKALDRNALDIKAAESMAQNLKSKGIEGAEWFGKEVLDRVSYTWKLGALLRLGYPVRNALEGNARTWAKAHAAATSLWMEGGRNLIQNTIKRGPAGREAAKLFQAEVNRADTLKATIEDLRAGYQDILTGTREATGAEAGAAVKQIEALQKEYSELNARVKRLRKAKPGDLIKEYDTYKKRTIGTEPMRLPDGTTAPGPFDGPLGEFRADLAATRGFGARVMREAQGDPGAFQRSLADQHRRLEGHAKERFELDWSTPKEYFSTDEGFIGAWLHAVNRQIRHDPIMARLAKGETDEQVIKWLRTPEGRKHRHEVPWQGADPEEWVRRQRANLDHYLPGAKLREAFKERDLRQADIDSFIAEGGVVPPKVHGAELDFSMGKGGKSSSINDVLGRTLGWISDVPETKLTRHPHYTMVYRQQYYDTAQRILKDPNRAPHKSAKHLDAEDLKVAQERAHEAALKSLKDTIYDASTRSGAAASLRWVSPFFASYQDSMSRWWNLAKENPDIMGYFHQMSRVPANTGVIVDENGEIVEGRGFKDGDKLLFALPSWAGGPTEKHPDRGVLEVFGSQMTLPISTFNVIFPGDPWWSPGVGPMATIPLSYVRESKPELNDLMKVVDPYGPLRGDLSDRVIQGMGPAWTRRLYAAFNDIDDDSFAQTVEWQYKQSWVDWDLAGRPEGEEPTWQDASERAKSLYLLRTVNNFGSPFPVQFQSKYQFAMDQYRIIEEQARDKDKDQQWVFQQFTERFPEALWIMTQSTSEGAGIAPTLEGHESKGKMQFALDKYPDFIHEFIDIGGGDEGEFNESVYAGQFTSEVSEGGERLRKRMGNEEAFEKAQISLGRNKYRRIMDLIEAEATSQGLVSWRDSDELKAVRDANVAAIKEENEYWAKDFDTIDVDKFNRELKEIQKIANDKALWKKLPERTDSGALKKYLELRALFQQELDYRSASGGHKTMTASTNADLQQLWIANVQQMVQQNTHFSDTWYYGRLEYDPWYGDTPIPTEEEAN